MGKNESTTIIYNHQPTRVLNIAQMNPPSATALNCCVSSLPWPCKVLTKPAANIKLPEKPPDLFQLGSEHHRKISKYFNNMLKYWFMIGLRLVYDWFIIGLLLVYYWSIGCTIGLKKNLSASINST